MLEIRPIRGASSAPGALYGVDVNRFNGLGVFLLTPTDHPRKPVSDFIFPTPGLTIYIFTGGICPLIDTHINKGLNQSRLG